MNRLLRKRSRRTAALVSKRTRFDFRIAFIRNVSVIPLTVAAAAAQTTTPGQVLIDIVFRTATTFEMAGLESMIVEEKQPPPKQIDREKVSRTRMKRRHAKLSPKLLSRHARCCSESSARRAATTRRPSSTTATCRATSCRSTPGRTRRCVS